MDSKIEKAQLGAQGDASNWVWNAAVNTVADLARIGSDTFRLGSGIGCALFNDQASASDKAWAVASDVFRGASIAGAGFAARALAKGIGKAAARASQRASKASARPLPQYTQSTIDDAVQWASREEKLTHLFPPRHNFEPLVRQLGGRRNTVRAVLNAANGKIPLRGVFENIPVNVKGYTVYIRGVVHEGIPKLGTMFIP